MKNLTKNLFMGGLLLNSALYSADNDNTVVAHCSTEITESKSGVDACTAQKVIYVSKKPDSPDLHFVMRRVSKENLGFLKKFIEKQYDESMKIFRENSHWKCNSYGVIQFEKVDDDPVTATSVTIDQEPKVITETSSTIENTASEIETETKSQTESLSNKKELSYAQMTFLSPLFVPLIKAEAQYCKGHTNKVPVTQAEIDSCREHALNCRVRDGGQIREGLIAFEESIRLYNDSSELWLTYALSGVNPERINDMSEDVFPNIEMIMTVFTEPKAAFTMHMGIFRTVYHEEAAFKGQLRKHSGISADLHAFAAKVMVLRKKKWMFTRPVLCMRKILSNAFGKESCSIGDRVVKRLYADNSELNVLLQERESLPPSLSFLNHQNLVHDTTKPLCLLRLEVMACRADNWEIH